jgi:Insertion element 4 transposase N-terminal
LCAHFAMLVSVPFVVPAGQGDGPEPGGEALAARVAAGPGLWEDEEWLAELRRDGLIGELLAGGTIGQAAAEGGHGCRQQRALNAEMILLCLVTGALFPGQGYDMVLAKAFAMPAAPARPGTPVPTGPALSQARARLGEQPARRAFELDAARDDVPPAAAGTAFGLELRLIVLAFFAQTLRFQLGTQKIALHLATNEHRIAADMLEDLNRYILRISDAPRDRNLASHKIIYNEPQDVLAPSQLRSDLGNVGADLSAVPLDEVLAFRSEHGEHYRAYVKGLRELLASQVQADDNERSRILHERSLEIREQAAELRKVSRKAFGARMATLLVSITGSAWTLHTGDPIGAMLAGAAAGLQAVPIEGQTVSAYSYLIQARDLGNR